MKRLKRAPVEIAHRHYQRGHKQEARQLCEELLLQTPNHVEALAFLGVLELEAGQPARAVERLARVVELAPTGENLCNLGLAYGRLSRFAEATEAMARAVQLAPTRAELVYNLGVVLLDAGDLPKARLCLMRAADLRAPRPTARAKASPAPVRPRAGAAAARGLRLARLS